MNLVEKDTIKQDNMSVIAGVKNPRLSAVKTMRRSHGISLMQLNECTNYGQDLEYCESKMNLADLHTKFLSIEDFERLRQFNMIISEDELEIW